MGLLLLLGACGENVPCNTDPSQIEGARAELKTAEQQLSSASAELAAAKQNKTKIEQQIKDLPETADLEQQLDVLKKGSGR